MSDRHAAAAERAADVVTVANAVVHVITLAASLLVDDNGMPRPGSITEEERLRIVRDCGRARDMIDMISPAGRRDWAKYASIATARTTIAREILALAQHRDPRIVGVGLAQIADRIAP